MSSGSYVPGAFIKDGRIDKDMVANVALGPELNILVNRDNDLNSEIPLQELRKHKPIKTPWEAPNFWI